MIWVYKCNSKDHPDQVRYGDWNYVFKANRALSWGSTKWARELKDAQKGDTILAYQTDRNELVGVARVTELKKRGSYLELNLRPVLKIGVKIRPLKKADPQVASIPAFKSGPIHTLYKIDEPDTRRLLRLAGIDFDLRDGQGTLRETTDAKALEGTLTESKRYIRGRSAALRRQALDRAKGVCEACRIDFSRVLRGRGVRVLQVHHRRQLAATKAPRVTKLSELAVVCANCHMLIHSNPKKALTVEQVRRSLEGRG